MAAEQEKARLAALKAAQDKMKELEEAGAFESSQI